MSSRLAGHPAKRKFKVITRRDPRFTSGITMAVRTGLRGGGWPAKQCLARGMLETLPCIGLSEKNVGQFSALNVWRRSYGDGNTFDPAEVMGSGSVMPVNIISQDYSRSPVSAAGGVGNIFTIARTVHHAPDLDQCAAVLRC